MYLQLSHGKQYRASNQASTLVVPNTYSLHLGSPALLIHHFYFTGQPMLVEVIGGLQRELTTPFKM